MTAYSAFAGPPAVSTVVRLEPMTFTMTSTSVGSVHATFAPESAYQARLRGALRALALMRMSSSSKGWPLPSLSSESHLMALYSGSPLAVSGSSLTASGASCTTCALGFR